MARYFFNVFDGADIFDNVGTELRGPKEARHHMLIVAMQHIEILQDHTGTWQMEAVDEDGKIIGTMDFGLEDKRRWPL